MAHEGLWEQLISLDQKQASKRAKCQFLTDPDRHIITMLNTEYVVNLSNREITSNQPEGDPAPAEFLEQLCLLAYLINAKDLPIANKLTKIETLPGGQFFFRGVHGLPIEKLEKAFGDHPECLYWIIEQLNAKQCEYGDASIELLVLPRLPITIVIWGPCDEFPPRVSILCDKTAGEHLPLDALLASINLTVDAMIAAYDKSS
jgi:hypothetical protein